MLFGVTLQPGALSLLLQRPAIELANYATTITDHPFLADLERVLLEPTFAGRVAILEAHLRLRFARTIPDYRYALVQAAVCHMARPGPLGHLADQLSVTPKSLTRYFQQVVGLTPKRCAQLARFKQALTEYRQLGRAWDHEAAGYADFAHFARASHRLTGRRLSEL